MGSAIGETLPVAVGVATIGTLGLAIPIGINSPGGTGRLGSCTTFVTGWPSGLQTVLV